MTYSLRSYCWGKSPQYTTTKSTLNDRKRQIPISDLPQTHQDAIKLTREFGIGYLWIDSMCICQDDYDDWERESARMLSVYANAYLTINASKGNDSSSGLFYKSSTREYFEFEHTYGGIRGRALACEVPFEEAMQHAYIQLKDDPVSHRGWTLQERVLSRRTLFYSGGQMMFECNHGFRKEDGWAIDGRFPRISSQPQMVSNDQTKDTDLSVSTSELLRSWYQLLATYGGRKLTKPSDKLPAVSGLASIMAERLNDEYVAGHWRSLLITELPWQPGDCKRVPEYRAPSWSWASVDGGIGIRLKGSGYSPLAEVLDVKVNLKGTNPYGEVTEGRLLIQGPMQRLCLSTEGWDPDRPRLSSKGSLVLCTTSTYLETRPQYDFDAFADDRPRLERKFVQSLDGLELYALILLACSHGEDHYIALMIGREQGSGEYRRVGILTLTDETLGWKPGEQRKGERPIITLI
uniref:Heterokaryon incompatibility domain-containing protein n=1 Tax=Gibberella zeae (strain ATCC MYA-4620 / CBS 123657 / FGSC 9075 / NRRL 31084 / PH-1) TaxID=229533 RepID=A0A098DGY3_GIBZE